MKKFLCVFICLLLLAGCEKSPKDVESEIPDFYGFKTDVKTIANNVSISANAEYTEIHGLVLTFTSPESVNGMKIKVKDDECEILYHSLSFFVPVTSMPFESLCVSLNACAKSVKTAIFQNNYYTYSYGENAYHLYIDDETKCFRKITVNENEILTFENFQFLYGTD
jgi:hypothetical protein